MAFETLDDQLVQSTDGLSQLRVEMVFDAVLGPESRVKLPALDAGCHEGPSVAVLRVHFPEHALLFLGPFLVTNL